ncbi:putative beta-ketoacyl synthase domain-containing protein [Colletotrichum sublineola]|uniref:Putative beta-ketoacyl synthase domain-containing protein n=1 Tax=Colletotrichum sublineola TaxID=1173701 RepID=A0A066XT69_COLSU|nr:putative beta-ketoacyl synthase domain-containing protein [Colletotrichum sublineola]
MHQGIQSLRTGEADMSIIGGANLTLNPDMFKALGSAGFLSGDGKCYAFDSRASGYGRGEGVATIVIKRLGDALAAGDPIRGVIRGSALNQDGKTETITTPSLEAQEALIRACYQNSGLNPSDTQYFEAHGTGTQAGDTVEARAIASVFKCTSEPLLIGSVKTNLGHTEAASGLASIVKTALALEKGVIPPSINFERPNPKIPLEDWRLRLVRKLEPWPAAAVRRASINNFGYGGANSHIIMEESTPWLPAVRNENGHANCHANGHLNEHPQASGENTTYTDINRCQSVSGSDPKVLVLSGKDEQACQRMIANLGNFLEQKESTQENVEGYLQSLAYTLGERRTRFPWIAAYPVPVAAGFDTVIRTLRSPKFMPKRSSRQPRIGMVFTGQGAQWHAMGRELIAAYPVYKASLEEAEKYLTQLGADWSLIEELSRDAESTRINSVALSTPICVAVQISLVRLLRSFGVVPVAVTSHSSGELAAAYAAGGLSYQKAMAFSYFRALLAADKSLQAPVKGGMIAVGLGLEDTQSYLERLTSGGKAVVACINSPSSITVAGDLSAVVELEDLANSEGVFARRLKVDTAWHSHHMANIASSYAEALEAIQSQENAYDTESFGSIAFSSPVTGGRVTSAKTISRPKHWVDSLVQPVQFVAALADMILGNGDGSSSNVDVIVEVGPHTALGGPIQQILALPEFRDLHLPYYGCLVRKFNAQDTMQALAAKLLQEGYPVDLKAINFPNGREQSVKVLSDLPSYPWNHQMKHWVEPRFNKALRERTQPPHDLLGSLVEGSNPMAPWWRHTLRISESPWTRDHVIQSSILYPAAGYICLAIEAIKQLTSMDSTTNAQGVSGYRLKDFDFLQALMIPESSDGIEIQTNMRHVSDKDVSVQGWKHFEVWTVTADNRWTQHAKGLIALELDGPEAFTPPVGNRDIKGYTKRVSPANLFANLRALGIAHGPMFQNMKSIVQSGSEPRSLVTMAVADISVPKDIPRHHVLNPVTLDSVITAPYSTVRGAVAYESAAKVPRSVRSFWVSSKISNVAGDLLEVHSQLIRNDDQGMEADVSVSGDGQVVLEMNGFTYQSLGQNLSSQQTQPWKKELCSKEEWSLDISLSSPATVLSIQKQLSLNSNPSDEIFKRETLRTCVNFMKNALAALGQIEVDSMDSDLAKHYAWMKHVVQKMASGQLGLENAERSGDNIERTATSQGCDKIVHRIGGQLVDILLGKVSPFDLMIQDSLLFKFYQEAPGIKRTGSQLAGLLRHLAHKNPRLRILEIGAGAGAMTAYALEALSTDISGGPRASSYHYTDISATVFEAARERFSSWKDVLSFDVLDIEREPATQGFNNGTYDVVVASRVLYNTKSISRTLDNVRSLLKHGGTLLLIEDLQDQIELQFVNGLLPGWYSAGDSEIRASGKPVLSEPILDRDLRDAGFTGADLGLYDFGNAEVSTSVVIMSSLPYSVSPKPGVNLEVAIITSKRSGSPPAEWIQGLQKSIAAHCYPGGGEEKRLPVVQDLESPLATATWYMDKVCIFLGEMGEPILYDFDSAALEGLRAMSTNCKGLLWVTSGGAVDCERPELSLATGFVRTLRTEYTGRKFLTLDLDPKGPLWSEAGASAVTRVLQTTFGNGGAEHSTTIGAADPKDFEYAERDGIILVPRFYHDVARDRLISARLAGSSVEDKGSTQPFFQANRPLCLSADSLTFTDDSYANGFIDGLAPDLVEIEPKAYGTHLHHTDKRVVSRECAGIITRVGSVALEQGYSVGDRVFCLLRQSSLPSCVIVEWTSAMPIPAELSFQDAAAMPWAFLTAYYSLVEVAGLRQQQSVLIHEAATDIGQAAIMIARSLKAEIFATVGSPEEREFITRKYALSADRILDNRNASFGPGILASTKRRGVDVVLNSLKGPLLQQSFNLVAPLGSFIDVGRHDVNQNNHLEMGPFARHVSFSVVDIPTLLEHRGSDVHRCLKEVVRLFETKAIAPFHPLSVYPPRDLAKVQDLLEKSTHLGKVVLSVDAEAMVPVLPRRTTARLSPDSSYMIVGGTGGLGRSVAHWMASHGAKNLVIVSRNASKNEKTAALAQELREAGCSRVLLVSGDVALEDDVANAIQTCAQEGMPAIRGLIHSAFVLRTTIDSKVAGVWNLHNQFNLPGDLDFFVMFSSINGILGYPSQAAYSAAGAYEDAIAHYRVKQCGLPAVSIDLSVVDDVGYVAEASSADILRNSLVKAGRLVIDEDQVLAALESSILSPYSPQFIMGGINSGPGSHWDVNSDLGRDMRFLPLKYRQASSSTEGQQNQKQSDSLATKMAACASHSEALRVVESALAEMLADMFLVPVEDIDMKESPTQQGVDSLMAVEVRNMLFGQAGAELSIFNILQSASLTQLATDVVNRSAHVNLS